MESSNFTHGRASNSSAQVALPVLMFAGGATGNVVAVVVLSVSRRERKSSAFYALVRGLAVTDLLGTCLASPLTISNYLDTRVFQDRRVCALHSFLLLFFALSGLSVICAMAAERYAAICCAYSYRRLGVDRRAANMLLLCIYLSHALFCGLPVMGLARSELQPSGTWCFISWTSAFCVLYGAVSLLLILGTILLNLAVCGALLFMRSRSARRRAPRGSVRERWRALSSAAETQMIAVLVMTSAVVLACSAPLVVRIFANRFKLDHRADLAAIRIASVNPILDPWIYILLRRSLFRRFLSRKSSSPLTRSDLLRQTHVLAQLMCQSSLISQLPITAQFTPEEAGNLSQTCSGTAGGSGSVLAEVDCVGS